MAYGNQNHRRFNNRRNSANYRRPNYRRNDANAPENVEKEPLRYPGLPSFVQKMDAHNVHLIRIIRTNADIRRYTALGIIKRLIDKDVIEKDSKNFVRFRWDKFTVCTDGMNTDYSYTRDEFLEAFAAAFTIIGKIAQKALEDFCLVERNEHSADAIDETKAEKYTDEITENQLAANESALAAADGTDFTEADSEGENGQTAE